MNTRLAVLGAFLIAAPAVASAQAIQELKGSVQEDRRWDPPPPQQAPEGLNEAAGVCGSLSFGSNKAECMKIVNSFKYFDVNAVRVCGGASFDNEKTGCLRAAGGKYFQAEAVSVCSTMSFGSNRAACLNATAGKMYLPAEISGCASSSFDNEKIGCFNSGGRPMEVERPRPPHRRCHDRDHDGYIIRELREIQRDFQRGRIPSGLGRLAGLIEQVDREMHEEELQRD